MGAFELSNPPDGHPGVDIISRIHLDYESKMHFQFQLQASSGDLSSVTEIRVHVQDMNDHRPVLKDFFIVFHNYPDNFPLHSMGRIPAYDPDENDTLTYSFVSGNEADLLILDHNTGSLRLSSNLNTNRQISAEMKACVSDGVNLVCAECSLRVVLVTQEMLLNSVTLRAEGVSRDDLLSPVPYSRLVDALSTLLPSLRDDIIIFSVQENRTVPTVSSSKEAGDFQPQINVSFSIRKAYSDDFISSEELRELVHLNREALSDVANLEILPFDDNLCVREPCYKFQQCQNVLKFGAAPDFVLTDNFLFRPVDPVSTFKCVCPEGFAGKSSPYECDTEVNLCYSSPCGSNGTCIQKENGYSCLCPPSRTGPRCEYPLITEFCLPGICRGGSICDSSRGRITCRQCPYQEEFSTPFCELRARSFSGNGFITLPPLKQRHRFQLELSVATVEQDGVLLYNGRYLADNDFVLLKLRDGYPEFAYSLGGKNFTKVAMAPIPQNLIADGQWHTIRIAYLDKAVTMSVDNCDIDLALRFSDGISYPKCAVHMEHTIDSKCADPAVICNRFLDLVGPLYVGGLPNSLRSHDIHKPWIGSQSGASGLNGCVRNLKIDGEILDLGKIVSNRGSNPGCSQLQQDTCTRSRPCNNPKECRSVWSGYKCNCDESVAGQNCTEETVAFSMTEDSFAVWKAPEEYLLPLTIGVTFRTRQTTTTPLVIVFQSISSNKLYLFLKIKNGQVVARATKTEVRVPFPLVSDGQWHTAVVTLAKDWVKLSLDHIYHNEIPLRNNEYFYKGLEQIYAGSPSGYRSAPFSGCIKGVHILSKLGHPQFLTLDNGGIYNAKQGCSPLNACATAPCPVNSHCLQDWDTYKCHCLPGYIGAQCMDVCSLKGLCKNGGTCMKFGGSYLCSCPPGFTGRHCEERLPPSGLQCPSGWWGRPLCGPCTCPTDNGYSTDCNKLTGECKCKSLHYKPKWTDTCFPCGCNFPYGARNQSCHSESGQCDCLGNVQGRTCHSCSLLSAEINKTTGVCHTVERSCPASYSREIDWSRTNLSQTARERCPVGSTGTATRYCRSDGVWEEPQLFNCTSHSFSHLASTLRRMDEGLLLNGYLTQGLAEELHNATTTTQNQHKNFYGQDVYVGYRLILALLRHEMEQDDTSLIHIQDKHFVRDLIKTCSDLLKTENKEWWTKLGGIQSKAAGHLLDTFDLYGRRLAKVHLHKYLKPFQAAAENMVFAVDSVESTNTDHIVLPKYDNFLQELNVFDIPLSVEIPNRNQQNNEFARPSVVFYSVYSSLDKIMSVNSGIQIGTPILSLAVYDSNGNLITSFEEPIEIAFPVNKTTNLTAPECVWWNPHSSSWDTSGCKISARNMSHITCACYHTTSFAVAMKPNIWQFTLVDDVYLSYVAPICGISCLALLCLTSVLLCGARIMEGVSNRRLIHQGIILSFALNVCAFMFVVRSRYDEIMCTVVGSVLHFSVLSLFCWLFLAVLHLYRTVTDLRSVDEGRFWPYFLFGILLPSLISAFTAAMGYGSIDHTNFCWFALFDPYVWSLIAPVSLVILLSLYVNAMCAMIAYSKEWDAMFTKTNFRNTLFRYFVTQVGALLVWLFQFLSLNMQLLWLHYAYNAAIVIYSVVLLVWLIFFEKKPPGDLKTAVSLWLTEEGSTLKQPPNGDVLVPLRYSQERVPASSRPESPVLEDELAPRNDEDSSAFHDRFSDPEIDCSNVAQVNNRMMTLPLRSGVTVKKPYYPLPSTNMEDEESARPFLSDCLSETSGSLKCYSKPDLIPSWEERLNRPSLTPQNEAGFTASYRSFTPMYRSPAYVSTAAPYTSTPSSRSILSPATKVLFQDSLTRGQNGNLVRNPEVTNPATPRLQTFSPQHSPKRGLGSNLGGVPSSRPDSNESDGILPQKHYFTSCDLGLRQNNLPSLTSNRSDIHDSETSL